MKYIPGFSNYLQTSVPRYAVGGRVQYGEPMMYDMGDYGGDQIMYDMGGYNEPVYQEPVYQEPVYQQPYVDPYQYQQPVYNEPVYAEPSYMPAAEQPYVDPYVEPYQYMPAAEQPYVEPYVAPAETPYIPGFSNYLETSVAPYVAPAEVAAPYVEPYQPTPTAQPMTQEAAPAAAPTMSPLEQVAQMPAPLTYEEREARRIAANTLPQGTAIVGPTAGEKPLAFGTDNTFNVGEGQEIRVVDAGGNVIFSGAGVEGANRAVAVAQSLSDELGGDANFKIQTGERTINPDGSVGGTRYIDVARAAPSQTGLGFLTDYVLPFAASFIPVVGPVIGAALGSAASSGLQGRSLEDTLTRAALAGGTAGLVSGTGLDKAIGGALSTTAPQAAGQVAGQVAGQLAGQAGGDIVVTGLSQALQSAGGALGSAALSQAANAGLSDVTGYQTPAEKFAEQPLPEAFQPPVDPYAGIDPIVVSGGTTAAPNVGGALSGVFEPIATDFLPKGGLPEPLPSEPAAPEPVDDSIIVNANRAAGSGLPFGASFPIPVNEMLSGTLNAAQPAQQTKTAEDIEAEKNPMVVTGGGLESLTPDEILLALGGAGGLAAATAGGGAGGTAAANDIVVTGSESLTPDELLASLGGAGAVASTASSGAGTDPASADAKKKLGLEEYLRIAGFLSGLVGGAAGGGQGQTGTYGGGGTGRLNPIFSAKLPSAGGLGSVGVNRTARPMGDVDWLTYGERPELSFYDYAARSNPAPVTTPVPNNPAGPSMYAPDVDNMRFARGGAMPAKRGGRSQRTEFAVNGPGTGRSDDIPAVLSDGEYVIDAETVALLGDGSSKAGAKKLDDLRVKIRKHKGEKLAKGRFSANAKKPEAYLSGGRV